MLQHYGINSVNILEDGPPYISIVRNGDRNLKGNFLYVFVEKRTHHLHSDGWVQMKQIPTSFTLPLLPN